MTWKQRDEDKDSNQITQPLVPGGKVTLVVMIVIAFAIIMKQILLFCGI
jgi:tyrosine-specific transport protein